MGGGMMVRAARPAGEILEHPQTPVTAKPATVPDSPVAAQSHRDDCSGAPPMAIVREGLNSRQ